MEQEQELLAYDKAVEKNATTEYELSPEQKKIAQKYTHTGTRQTSSGYKWTQRQRKPNATKAGIIAEIAEFLEKNSQFSVENVVIANKERQISFAIGADVFEFTLVQKRKPKK